MKTPIRSFVLTTLPGTTPAPGVRDPAVDVLAHPSRQRMLQYVSENPVAYLTECCNDLEINRGTAAHHLYAMERAGLLTTLRVGRELHFYAMEEPSVRQRLFSLLRKGRVLELIDAVTEKPGARQNELTKALSMSRKVFRGYADLLAQEGLLDEIRESRLRRYFPTELLRGLLGTSEIRRDEAPAKDLLAQDAKI